MTGQSMFVGDQGTETINVGPPTFDYITEMEDRKRSDSRTDKEHTDWCDRFP